MTAENYALFLRGVNVGGIRIKMADVAAALTGAGFTAVRTVLASGNVIAESEAPVESVRERAQLALRDRFGYEAWVLAYPLATVADIVAAYPFEPAVDGHHSYVTFVAEPMVLAELAALDSPGERIEPGDGVLYWQVPKAATVDSALGKTMGKARFKASTTTRNLRTLTKVLAG